MEPTQQDRLARLDRLAELLDDSIRIPGIGYRIGYDAIIGLIPGIGDAAGVALSTYIVVQAARYRLPKSTLLRMVANVAIEATMGAIPIIGDVFDAVYKANNRNMRLLHRRLEGGDNPPREDKLFFTGVLLVPLAIIVLLVGLVIWLITTLI